MKTFLDVVLLVLCQSVVPGMAYDTNSLNTRIITNWRPPPSSAFETQTGVPLMIYCVVKCASNPACTAIDHFEDTCYYFTGDQFFVEDSTAAGHTLVIVRDIFLINAAKTFYSRTLTFSEAQQACSTLGGRLATYAELQTLFATGFELCTCSYIDTGASFVIMQEAISGCGGDIGILQCGISLAAAWCYIYPL